MKIHILSDLHNEFAMYIPSDASKEADVIVLAGDIWKGSAGIPWARETWPDKEIVYIAGNHEFYGHERRLVIEECRQVAKEEGVHFLDNDEVIIDGVRFLGSTLWMDFKLFGEDNKDEAMYQGMNALNDFRRIREGQEPFNALHAIALCQESVDWLSAKLKERHDGKTVVVTHHLPSKRSCAPRFMQPGNFLSACFASNLDHLFGRSALWIHGHTHDSFDYSANRTRVVCNPRGYARYSKDVENPAFDPDLIVEI